MSKKKEELVMEKEKEKTGKLINCSIGEERKRSKDILRVKG